MNRNRIRFISLLTVLLLAVAFIASYPDHVYAGMNVSITRTFQPSSGDSYVMQKDPDKADQGTNNLMWVTTKATGENERSFVKFDLSTIPLGSTISSATMSLYMKDAPSESRTLEAQRASASWVETTITWNNQPGVSGSAVTAASGTAAGWVAWTVTADVQAFIQNQTATNSVWSEWLFRPDTLPDCGATPCRD